MVVHLGREEEVRCSFAYPLSFPDFAQIYSCLGGNDRPAPGIRAGITIPVRI
jgi:hypothetical protein